MDPTQMPLGPDYSMPHLVDYGIDHYLTEETSTNSSPSPVMINAMHLRPHTPLPPQMYDPYVPAPENISYDSFPESQPPGYQYYDMMQPMPIVEFTDLTAPYQEDRRRRRSQVRDKQALSSMHMVSLSRRSVELNGGLTITASPSPEQSISESVPRAKGEARSRSSSPAGRARG